MGQRASVTLIDGQNSFMADQQGKPLKYSIHNVSGRRLGWYQATLGVPGAVEAMQRFADMVDRCADDIDDIDATFDTHLLAHISHGCMWQGRDGNDPPDFTEIKSSDIRSGVWTCRSPELNTWALYYTEKLEQVGKYTHRIWPVHCELGSWGHNLHHAPMNAFRRWQELKQKQICCIEKGMPMRVECFSGVEPEVEDPLDSRTKPDMRLIRTIERTSGPSAIGGVAGSHCFRSTVLSFVKYLDPKHFKRIHLLTDCIPPIPKIGDGPDYPAITQNFLRDMKSLGMNLTKSTEFLV